jgi:large subunit ribosomal protein L15
MSLGNLKSPENKKRKRLGRGESSGLGKTCGKGHKGQKSRSGGKVSPGFEGGQMPLQRRLPKRGFNNPRKIYYNVVNVKELVRLEPGTEVTPEVLREKGIVRRSGPVKILSQGEVSGAYSVKVDRVSSAAREKIVAAGGSVEEL